VLNEFAFALINGLANGMAVFLVAAGLTLVFGILKILNFAHGGFFMIGAYVAFTVSGRDNASGFLYLAAAIVAGGAVAALGWAADRAIFRRLRQVDEAYSLIATFALLMVCSGAVKLIWGLDYRSISPPDAWAGAVQIGPLFVPSFSLLVFGLGVVVFILLDLAIHRMWFGKIVQCIAHDQWMAGVIGFNVPAIFTGSVIAAFFLAGFAGGLLLPNQALSPELAGSFLLQAFVVVIVGGLGNIRGAFIAAFALGVVESLNSVLMPTYPGFAIYIAMIAFLLWRPDGLLAHRKDDGAAAPAASLPPPPAIAIPPATKWMAGLIAAAAFLSVPLWAHEGLLFIAGLTLIEAVFALSWNLLFGFAGLATFGHAAFFAVGAYLVGFALKSALGVPFPLLLLMAAALGAAAALLVGSIAIRRTAGIAMAILTLAVSELVRLTIIRTHALGRDDGLSAIPRPSIDFGFAILDLSSSRAYYLFLFCVCATAAAILWALTQNHFGRVLRSIRQDPARTEFLGVPAMRYRLTAFAVAGAAAALAGGLQAPWSQIVTPDAANYLHSTQPMLNALLGGVDFFWGPAVGAVLFSALAYTLRNLPGLSELITGGTLLVVVLAAPSGILGSLAAMAGRRRTGPGASLAVEASERQHA